MSIRDIIEAAPRRTVYNDCSDRSMARLDNDKCALCEDAYHCQRRFIATFNPEHVALMEAVCEIVGLPSECCNGDCQGCGHPELCGAARNLQAYRKERGL